MRAFLRTTLVSNPNHLIVGTFLPIETKAVKTKCQSNLYKSLIYSFILLHRIITADMQNQGDEWNRQLLCRQKIWDVRQYTFELLYFAISLADFYTRHNCNFIPGNIFQPYFIHSIFCSIHGTFCSIQGIIFWCLCHHLCSRVLRNS